MTRQQSTPKPENAQNRAKDAQRMKDRSDERLSPDAGYGRTESTPNPKTSQ